MRRVLMVVMGVMGAVVRGLLLMVVLLLLLLLLLEMAAAPCVASSFVLVM